MQCFRYLMPIMRSPRVSAAGAFEIAYFLFLPWLQVVGSLIYALSAVVVARYALTFPGGPVAWLASGAWAIVPLFVGFGLGPFVVWGFVYRATARRDLTLATALALGVANWLYLAVHYASIWWAFVRVVSTRHDWKKTTRSGPMEVDRLADGLPGRPVPCTLRFAPSGAPSGPNVIPGRLRFRAPSPDPALTEVS